MLIKTTLLQFTLPDDLMDGQVVRSGTREHFVPKNSVSLNAAGDHQNIMSSKSPTFW